MILSLELAVVLKSLLVLLSLVVLIIVLGWILKKLQKIASRSISYGQNGQPLRILDTLIIDQKRRLIAIEWQNCQHLILIGLEREQIVQSLPKDTQINMIPVPSKDAHTLTIKEQV